MTTKTSRLGDPNRLSIAHLLIWVTITAVFVVEHQPTSSATDQSQHTNFVVGAARILTATFSGLACAGMVVVIWRGLVNHVRIDPGEWLLFVLGATIALDKVAEFWPPDYFLKPKPLAGALGCLATVIPTLSRKLRTSWKSFFAIAVLFQATMLATAMVNAQSNSINGNIITGIKRFELAFLVSMPVLLVAWQWKSRKEHNTLHWFGVALFTVSTAVSLFFGVKLGG